jgi:hypothetical protein
MKTLKFFFAAVAILVLVNNSWAKSGKIGIYLTAEDYINHKLSYETDGKDGKVKLNEMFASANVVVVENGTRKVLPKKQIFGYRLDNDDYRYYNNQAYRILDTQGFLIYTSLKLAPATKGVKPTPFYFFSAKPEADIKQLTMDNLQEVFSANTKFLYSVESLFKSDSELTAYDPTLKTYKIKYLYEQTLK